ncbi:MAG: isocitrate/isopropylmalate dehydrogenase family protein [Candidatus Thermoplasmatota archaeon]
MKRVCVLPGDGIGPEVVGCATRVLEAVAPGIELVSGEIGQSAMDVHGSPLPARTLDLIRGCDSCLFGAVTSPSAASHPSPVLTFRKELDLFANLRPVRNLVSVQGRPPIDVVIVRENSEGLYHQPEVEDAEGVTTHRRVTARASRRIVDFAIGHARSRGRRGVCCVHKANVLRRSDGLFLDVFRERMRDAGAGLMARDQLVDSAALLLVTDPSYFDVIVTLNLYGDILSDLAAGVAGGLGFAPSGNIGPRHSVFEPAHGSAPDIAGKGVANPTAAILSASMMLEHIGMGREAAEVSQAVIGAYADGALTVDVGGALGSAAFTELVLSRLRR